ncbi:MAG: 3'-5' exonuclease [Clostridia bacterium]|nr:3'-5' exonuclease [Clostridia bacterium]
MILYFDTETTGLKPGQICQLSYIMQTKTDVKAKNFFFNVDFVEYGAYMVHGFSVEKLKNLSGGKTFADCFNEIEEDFLSADLLCSHNTAFDFSFMRTEFERLGKPFIINNEFCTMKKSTPVCKLLRSDGITYKYPKLNELCNYFAIRNSDIERASDKLFGTEANFHDARFDTTAVYLIVNEGFKCEKIFKEIEPCL